ncbi:MAG TPA: hypothetical protein VGR35_11240 [Tepidisphaeraceae bacterium]|nr:hypothetical protein [Tepidisphaeraceae bacterium]
MSETRKNVPNPLRDRLLAAERVNGALRTEYERKMTIMWQRTISMPKRVWFAVLATACLAASALMFELQISDPLPTVARVGLGLGTVFSLGWAAFLGRIAWRGEFTMKRDATLYATMVWVFTLAMAVLLAVMSRNRDPFVIYGFLFLLPASVIVLRTAMEQSELRTQERLLGLEYKLALLAERAPQQAS